MYGEWHFFIIIIWSGPYLFIYLNQAGELLGSLRSDTVPVIVVLAMQGQVKNWDPVIMTRVAGKVQVEHQLPTRTRGIVDLS